jgi:acyl carrier protein
LTNLRAQLGAKGWLPIRGVVHAAGSLADATLASIGPGSFEAVHKPKVLGARRVLESLVGDDAAGLEFFVGFSSVASLLGLPAQASYAAANGQMDALLGSWRRTKGLPTATVQLGGVADVGMSARVDDHVHAWGVGQIASGDFAGLLNRVIEVAGSADDASAMVVVGANLDFRTLAKTRRHEQNHELSAFLPDSSSLKSPLTRFTTTADSSSAANHTNHSSSSEPAGSRPGPLPRLHLEDVIKAVAGVVEEVSGLADIPTDASLYDSGLDSLSAIQLRNVLAEKFPDVEFAATLVFDHTSIDKISAYILQQLTLIAPGISPNAGPRNSPGNQALEPGSNRAKPDGSRGVAIIGVEARMPGSSNSFESFFANLCAGVDGIRDVPYARWDADDFFDPNPTAGGKACYVQRAGFVDDIEYFDNETFGITPMEAKVMDPSQRVMLETAYRAFAAAGYEPSRLKDTNTGVFVGSLSPDWRQVLTAGELTAYSGTGSALSIMANRISYFFGLLGPSMTVDTACSSSLVAMDLALQNIASGRCTMALVGGVQSILTNSPFINGCRARMLSPKGHCHTWDAGADGYAKAEGCGALVLKELAAAER